MAAYKSMTIANEVIRQCHNNGITISHLKLQKLLYFVQAHYLVTTGSSLFEEDIEAWEYGPVIPEVYQYFKTYGSNPIPLNHYFSRYDENDKRELMHSITGIHSIEYIIGELGNLSAYELVDLSHNAGSPWDQTYNSEDLGAGCAINHALIHEYYSI